MIFNLWFCHKYNSLHKLTIVYFHPCMTKTDGECMRFFNEARRAADALGQVRGEFRAVSET